MTTTQIEAQIQQLERKRRENRRQLDRLMLSGRTHGATLNAIERRQERDLKYTRELARLEAEAESIRPGMPNVADRALAIAADFLNLAAA